MTLKELSTAVMEKEYANSTIPKHAWVKKTYSDKSANDLTKAILAYLKLKDIFAHRQSSEGRWRQGKEVVDILGRKRQLNGMYIPGAGKKGAGDILAVFNGITVNIEVKYGKDRIRPEQLEYKENLERSGGKYLIVKTWDDFYFQFSNLK